MPPPPPPASWPFDLESGVRVTCDVSYLCANFSLPRPLCSRLRPDVRDRQTSDAYHRLMPLPWGRGHKNSSSLQSVTNYQRNFQAVQTPRKLTFKLLADRLRVVYPKLQNIKKSIVHCVSLSSNVQQWKHAVQFHIINLIKRITNSSVLCQALKWWS